MRQPFPGLASHTLATSFTHFVLPTVAPHSQQHASLKCVNAQSSAVRQARSGCGRAGAFASATPQASTSIVVITERVIHAPSYCRLLYSLARITAATGVGRVLAGCGSRGACAMR